MISLANPAVARDERRMNRHVFDFCGTTLAALPSGALWWEAEGLLCLSDLHLGKSERIARRSGAMLPPYETQDTLARIAADLAATGARTVLCLGDSFDDLAAAAAFAAADRHAVAAMQAGRRWIWIEGNHDAGDPGLGGERHGCLMLGGLTFCHIARLNAEPGEVSGHYHPKAALGLRGTRVSRRCFLQDGRRLVMPAYGTYTGGLSWTAAPLRALFGPGACAILLGEQLHAVPVPAAEAAPRARPYGLGR